MLDPKLLAILVCPVSKAPLEYQPEQQELVCRASGLAYPIRDDIPVMLESEARSLSLEEREDEHCVVIQDIHPQAPTHVLIIPRKPIPRLVDAQHSDSELLGHLLLVAGKVANDLGVGEGFRLVINNGADGGQTVFHLHLHILAGRSMAEGELAGGLA